MGPNDYQSPLLRQTLNRYSHLDLTSNVVRGAEVQKGGGGFSDVFQSMLDPRWQPRPDPNIAMLLQQQVENPLGTASELMVHQNLPMGSSLAGTRVAVKRLRFWTKPISEVERVGPSFIAIETTLYLSSS